MEKYPYFITPLLTELRQGLPAERASRIRMMLAANIGDTRVLERLLGEKDPADGFYPTEQPVATSTESTIDTFIEKFSKPKRKKREEPEEYSMEDVKNLVKNKEYARALDIMEQFYLNNPKKSVYFADQIRFIRKLMLNEQSKSLKS